MFVNYVLVQQLSFMILHTRGISDYGYSAAVVPFTVGLIGNLTQTTPLTVKAVKKRSTCVFLSCN